MILALVVLAIPQEESLFDSDFERSLAPIVRGVEAVEKRWKDDPAAALARVEALLADLERDVLPKSPRWVETTLVVRWRTGIAKNEEKERHAFFPYRLAGEVALAAGRPERAVEHFSRSPSSKARLEEARKEAAAAKEKPREPAPALQRPGFAVEPLLQKKDFAAALAALRQERAKLGNEYDVLLARARDEAARHQKAQVDDLAGVLPRLLEEGFEEKFVRPCLAACERVPPELEAEPLRWARRLGAWTARKDPAELDRLAVQAVPFGADYHAVCRIAQQRRLDEIDAVAAEAARSPRESRPALLARLDAAERAFLELSRVREFPEFREKLAAAKERFPISADALERARAPARSVEEVRIRARDLEILWGSPDRRKLSAQDQADLAGLLGAHRCTALFLEGRTVPEAARDPLVVETLRGVAALPPGSSPKVEAVRRLLVR
jgi:hypothetical protein